ncbi:uncharacterized protein MONBRDRAFT_9617 [Monosiga brevicollis MX1]|uniref:ABC transporter domain-containing protein n=1 Tax=Monosiga brevicollis TaxID=81824 RepID=A9V3V3_MONBE|nr:uncharacterized protein MONBRDRAFT_9617 [Monosiga brevicollis MX1]EDQ87774.1 predicted protein [Monosiga brevicollis MX1]|eukprot:XP_001747307.1 hypothetical protein [Monosiga brevicollis MX1]
MASLLDRSTSSSMGHGDYQGSLALEARGVFRGYGPLNRRTRIVHDFDMRVPRGLYGMADAGIESRLRELLQLLDMSPFVDRLVGTLSGGQQRRVSFMVALIHQPPLLILKSRNNGTLATTPASTCTGCHRPLDKGAHAFSKLALDEQADMVGMMRDGRLLAEAPPRQLMNQYGMDTLEEVFLDLSRQDSHKRASMLNNSGIVKHNVNAHKKELVFNSSTVDVESEPLIGTSLAGGRNYGVLVFEFVLPAIQIILFCLAIGRDPTGLNVAIINEDVGANLTDSHVSYSTQFLSHLDHKTFNQVTCTSVDEALHKVERGEAWAMYHFGVNYTQDVLERVANIFTADEALINASQIHIAMDNTNEQISVVLVEKTMEAYEACVFAPCITAHSLRLTRSSWHTSVHSKPSDGVRLVSITFAQAIGLTALAFVMDRKDGMTDRAWVAGVVPSEIILAHVGTQMLVLVGQLILVLIFTLLVFKLPLHGSLLLVILLLLLLGTSGMTCILWPLESIPIGLSWVAYAMPTTWASTAMRSLMLRGWGLAYQDVWLGFVVVLAWILVLIFAAIAGIRSID